MIRSLACGEEEHVSQLGNLHWFLFSNVCLCTSAGISWSRHQNLVIRMLSSFSHVSVTHPHAMCRTCYSLALQFKGAWSGRVLSCFHNIWLLNYSLHERPKFVLLVNNWQVRKMRHGRKGIVFVTEEFQWWHKNNWNCLLFVFLQS